MTPFKYKIPIQIRFNDIDLLGHVNSAVHLTYFELARVSYFNHLDKELKIDWATMSFVVAKMEMEYKQQIMLEDKLFVSVWVSRIGTKSFDMTCSIVRDNDGVETEVAKGMAIIVCFNFKLNQTVAFPVEWKEKMLNS
jgi:acyl-CoA thioester hydrolase